MGGYSAARESRSLVVWSLQRPLAHAGGFLFPRCHPSFGICGMLCKRLLLNAAGGALVVTPDGGATELGVALLGLLAAIWRVVRAIESLART